MANQEPGNSPAGLDEKLATYWQLVDEREMLEARLSRARTEKDSVPERIFRRVMAEYETALDAVASRLTPLKDELDTLRRTIDADLKALDATIQETEDNIAEARFRHRVGEFDADTLTGVIGRLEATLGQGRQRRGGLQATLDAMDRRRPERATVETTAPAANPAPAAGAAPAPEPAATPAADAPDPNDPLLELRESSLVSGVSATAHPPKEDDDPLSALSDPSPARERETPAAPAPAPANAGATPAPQTQASGPARATAVAPSYPSLVIRSGVHEGKIVPLLPITMSIGREHDNNIELKDEEVSRYHARIIYENGRFVVEDLESSSGTWINGVRQRRAALSDGDVVRIGTTELAYEVA